MFVQFIRVPVISAYPVDLVEGSLLGFTILTSGSYGWIPYADDDFDSYPTGFRTSFSGIGYWNGSGYAFSRLSYLAETFDEYATGQNAYNYYTGFGGSIFTNNYTQSSGFTTGYTFDFHTGYYRTRLSYPLFDNYATGYTCHLDSSGAFYNILILTTGFTGTLVYGSQTGTITSGRPMGYTIITGSCPPVPMLFENFEGYVTGFNSGAFLNKYNLSGATSSGSGEAVRVGNPIYVETFLYPQGVPLSTLRSGIIFYDYWPESYQFINYTGKVGFL